MWHKRALHMRDLRLQNNAGMDFPVSHANARLLDLDKGRLPTTGDFAAVTCKRCRERAPRRYPWASYGKGA